MVLPGGDVEAGRGPTGAGPLGDVLGARVFAEVVRGGW